MRLAASIASVDATTYFEIRFTDPIGECIIASEMT